MITAGRCPLCGSEPYVREAELKWIPPRRASIWCFGIFGKPDHEIKVRGETDKQAEKLWAKLGGAPTNEAA